MPRRLLKRQEKQAVLKCFSKFMEIGNSQKPLKKTDAVEVVASIFSISRSEVFKLLNDGYDNVESSGVGRNLVTDKFLNYNFRKDLQSKIWDLNRKNEYFTLDTLLQFAVDELEFEGGRTTLWRVIKSMGYKFKTINGRKILCEQKHVIAAKITFLRKYQQLKQSHQNYEFVFLDETWIYQNGSNIRRWVHDTDIKSNPAKIKAEGKRFTILHAGCTSGFLQGCDLLLDSKNNDRDYHKTMNGEIFKTWVDSQLLPALQRLNRKCVVVMDNAPYHSMRIDKPPTFSSNKQQMQEWLTRHNITFHGTLTKKQLWELIKPIRQTEKKYLIDSLLQRNGHEVLRLPPYHCQYNPIEMAWGYCKTYYNKHINSRPSSKDKVANLWLESISLCKSDMWQNYIRHCERLIEEDWSKLMGNCSIDNIPPVIISLGESDSETEDESDVENDLDFEEISELIAG